MFRRKQFIFVALLAAAVGCGDGIEMKPVALASGKVLCQGQPVANASVLFNPVSQGKSALAGRQAYANTDANGEFVLSTYGNGDGAVVGKHKVIVAGDPQTPCNCYAIDTRELMEVEIKADSPNVIEVVLPVQEDPAPMRQSSSDMEDED
jgi:hypothetical protein